MDMRAWSIGLTALALTACGEGGEVAEAPARETPSDGPAATAAAEVSGPTRTILAFGDSLFAGYGIGVENSYPAQLQEVLRGRGVNAQIVNAAVSGETSGAGRQRLAFALDNQQVKPDLVLLELGGNDMLRGLPPEETRANFAAMLAELQRRGIPVLIMGMRAPPNYGPQYQQAFDGLYSDLAREYDTGLIPFWLESIYLDPTLFQNDRVHPTQEGIATLVEDTVDEVEAALPLPQG